MKSIELIGKISSIRLTSNFECDLLNTKCDTLLVSYPGGYSPLSQLKAELKTINTLIFNKLERIEKKYSEAFEPLICGFNLTSSLRLLMTPNQNSLFYRTNCPSIYFIWKDFVYASIYYTLVLASKIGSKKLAITHTIDDIQDKNIKQKYIKTLGDAIGLYADSFNGNTIEEIKFVGCCLDETIFEELYDLSDQGQNRVHNNIEYEFSQDGEIQVLCLKGFTI